MHFDGRFGSRVAPPAENERNTELSVLKHARLSLTRSGLTSRVFRASLEITYYLIEYAAARSEL